MPGPGGVPGPGEDAWSGGCLVPGGGDPPETATAAGGTHPTGMHSCLTFCFEENDKKCMNLFLS